MRILVMLDPTNKRGTKKPTQIFATLHRNELYMRITPIRKTAEKHLRRLSEHSPGTGTVRVLKLTEKQYEGIWYLTGSEDLQEKTVGRNCHVML